MGSVCIWGTFKLVFLANGYYKLSQVRLFRTQQSHLWFLSCSSAPGHWLLCWGRAEVRLFCDGWSVDLSREQSTCLILNRNNVSSFFSSWPDPVALHLEIIANSAQGDIVLGKKLLQKSVAGRHPVFQVWAEGPSASRCLGINYVPASKGLRLKLALQRNIAFFLGGEVRCKLLTPMSHSIFATCQLV